MALVGTDEAFGRLTKLADRKQTQRRVLRGIRGCANKKLVGLTLRILTDVNRNDPRFAVLAKSLARYADEDLPA